MKECRVLAFLVLDSIHNKAVTCRTGGCAVASGELLTDSGGDDLRLKVDGKIAQYFGMLPDMLCIDAHLDIGFDT